MAEGKKSFVLYTDLIEIAEELTDEEAGLLFKTILRYVNDLNPEIPKSIKLAFIPIKQDLKRDLKAWEDIKTKRADAGRLGGLARANNIKQNQAKEANAKIVKQNQANQAVNVNDNVNVNVNVNDNVSKDNKKNISSEPRELALELPTIYDYKKGNIYPVYQDQIDKWQEVYIGVDVNLELNKMLVWLEANPSKKKTYNGMARFIVNWLSRQQDSAARNGIVNQINENERRPNETEAEYKKRMNGGFDTL